MLNARVWIVKSAALVVVSVLLCLLPLLTIGIPATQAETVCTQSATTELAYDDGIAMDRALPGMGGCPSCTIFQGVKFQLPHGLSSSTLTATRIYAGTGKGKLVVYVTDAQRGYLSDPITFNVNGTRWYDVTLPNIVVGSEFYIFAQREKKETYLTKLVEPYYDSRRHGTSVCGSSVEAFVIPPGDFMIRAVIVPQVNVGPGQDYETIQEAVDSVWDGWTITVHKGTYSENVTVDKSVIIRSLSGAAQTIVRTSPPYSDNNVFRITASCVRLSGFTIEGGDTHNGRAGVLIEEASGCVVSENVILGNNYGIYVTENSTRNILLENDCKSNETGIYIDGSENYVSGNKLHGNTAPIGSAVFLSSIASGTQLRFNTVTVDPGTDPAVAAGPQVYNQNSNEQVSAIGNWWGTDTGPTEPSNPGGQGPVVGQAVLYNPWLTKQPLRVETAAASGGDFTMDARAKTSTVVLKQGAGTPIVSAASFGENPFDKLHGKPTGQWIDVLFSSTNGIDEVEIRQSYTVDQLAGLKEGSLRLFWWNGDKWKVCSKTGVDKKNDFVWAKLNVKSKPSPSDLTGTMFAVGAPKGGFAWWLIPLIIFIVILLLVVFRLIWVLVVKREDAYTSIE
jgi:parallel beta-helix repeat protein